MQQLRELRCLQSACLGALLALVSACGSGENGTDARGGDAGADHGVRDVAADRAVDVAADRAVDVAADRAVDVADVAADRAVDVADVADAVDTSVDLCVGVVCSALDACHSVGVCNPATGMCSNPVAADGSACNDGNACTQSDTCQTGSCSGANPVTCAASDQCHAAGVCNPATGACSNPAVANGTACNDGLTCTSGDTCTAGTCGGAPTASIDQSQTSFNNGNVIHDGAQSFTPAVSGQMTTLTLYKNGLSGAQSITLEVRLGSGIGGTLLYTGVHLLPNLTGPTTITLGSVLDLTAGTVYTFRITDLSQTFSSLGQTGNPYVGGAWVYDTAYGTYFIDQQFDLWFQIKMLPTCP